jgi:pyruvate dehydrogenase (quinone)
MSKTGGDMLIETLIAWGVDTIFGIPGDGINGIMESLRQQKDKIRFVQTRHEEGAAFMACAYAKFTGKLGVCLATSGPGGIHLLNGLYDAKLDQVPVLAITGMQFHDLLSTFTQQDVELDKLFMDVAPAYNARIMGAAHVQNVTELACRTALSTRGVAHITMPIDIQLAKVESDARSERNTKNHVSDVPAEGAHEPDPRLLAKAAEVLNAGKKVVIMAGRGAIGCGALLTELAELLGAPVVKPLLGKTALADTSPYTTGGVGLLGTKASQAALEECDTLLIVGATFPYIEFYPKPGQARCVQIDLNPQRIGIRYPAEVGLVGDTATVLKALLPRLRRNEHRSFLEHAQKAAREWLELLEIRGTHPEIPMKPQVVTYELSKRLPANAIVTSDSGTCTTWAARYLMLGENNMFSVSGALASMACGLPYANAAAIAYPGRPVIAVVGDGGFAMLMSEFITSVKYNLNVKIIVIKNNTLGQIKWEQMVMEGNPEFGCELEPIDFVAVARAMGGKGFTINDPAQCGAILDQALSTPGPVVIEAVVDPNEPPLPPNVTVKQAMQFAKALAKGTHGAGKIAMTVLSDTVREIV